MISHAGFGELRLAQYLDPDDIEELTNWEYEEHLWVGEADGFSQWLCLEDEPEVLRALSLDFQTFPKEEAIRVLLDLDLALRAGAQIEEIRGVLGREREAKHFVPDRVTYEFDLASPDPYTVSCTVLNEGGLTYLTVMTAIE